MRVIMSRHVQRFKAKYFLYIMYIFIGFSKCWKLCFNFLLSGNNMKTVYHRYPYNIPGCRTRLNPGSSGRGVCGLFLFFFVVFFFVWLKIQRYCFFVHRGRKRKQCLTRTYTIICTPYARRHTKTSCLSMCGVSNIIISRAWLHWQNGNTASGSHDGGGGDRRRRLRRPVVAFSIAHLSGDGGPTRAVLSSSSTSSSSSNSSSMCIGFSIRDQEAKPLCSKRIFAYFIPIRPLHKNNMTYNTCDIDVSYCYIILKKKKNVNDVHTISRHPADDPQHFQRNFYPVLGIVIYWDLILYYYNGGHIFYFRSSHTRDSTKVSCMIYA